MVCWRQAADRQGPSWNFSWISLLEAAALSAWLTFSSRRSGEGGTLRLGGAGGEKGEEYDPSVMAATTKEEP